MIKKFEKDDILHNVIIANPKVKFRIFKGSIYGKFNIPAALTLSPQENALDFSVPENSGYIAAI